MSETSHKAYVELLTGIIRVYAPGIPFGGPYAWCATLHWLTPDTLEVKGVMRAPTMAEYHSVLVAAHEHGVQFIRITRKSKNGTERVSTVRIQNAIDRALGEKT